MKKLLLCLLALSLVSCGSSKKKERELEEREHEEIQRDYVVREASSNVRPGWVEDAGIWARSHKGYDVKKYRYFSHETEPKSSRSAACKIADSQVNTNIAGEISTFMDRTLATAMEGDASIDENNPDVKALEQYISESLVEKIVGEVNGARRLKKYWEKRQYLKKKGAKRDYKAFTCATFIQMPADILKRAIEKASKAVVNQAPNGVKAKVQKAMEGAANKF